MRFIICTITPDFGAALAKTLIDERLIGGCNIVPGVRSLYRWQGKVHDEPEELMLMETTTQACEQTMRRIAALHPYDVPKIVALEAADVHAAYLEWLGQVVGD